MFVKMNLKSLMGAVVLTVTQGVLATSVGPQNSWEEIHAAGLTFDMPRIGFGTIFVPVSNVCKAGSSLKTMNPVLVCVATGHGQQSTDCTQTKEVSLETSAFYQTKECRRWAAQHECVESAIVTKPFVTDYKISVYRPSLNPHGPGGAMPQLAFSKPYSIPSCPAL